MLTTKKLAEAETVDEVVEVAQAQHKIIAGLGIIDDEAAEALGGVTEVAFDDNRLYSAAFKRTIDAQPKFPVFIPGDYAEIVQINGLTFRINPEQVVMVPQSVKEVLDNKRAMEREANQHKKRAKANMNKSLQEMPLYVG